MAIRGLAVVVRNNRFPAIAKALPPAVRDSAYRSATALRDRARGLAPVDTGALRASITVTQDRTAGGQFTDAFVVYSPLEYSVYQEYGFHHAGSGAFVPPQPFMAPAAAQEWPAYQNRTIQVLRKLP